MEVGYAFERSVVLPAEEIVRFATDVGDTNPLHHDAAYASTTRFGGLIASGAHPVAIAIAMCGAQASLENPGVGLAFSFTLLGAVKPGETLVIRWEVAGVEESERPRGTIVDLRGVAVAENDRPVFTATARTLMVEKL